MENVMDFVFGREVKAIRNRVDFASNGEGAYEFGEQFF
jgi:hypothetical protein